MVISVNGQKKTSSRREGNIYTWECLSVHHWWGGYPIPGLGEGYPVPGLGGWGYPVPGLDGEVPHPRSGWGTPLTMTGWGTPPNHDWMG